MRLLLTGAGGFLGSRLLSYYREKYEIWAPSHKELDLTDAKAVRDGMGAFAPDAVIHCAALSDVGSCEKDPGLSAAINVEGTKNLAACAGERKVKLLFCSSDQVYFDGPAEGNYGVNFFAHRENEILHPIPVYGQHKVQAETLCQRLCPDSVILRLTWMYGELTKQEQDRGKRSLGEILRRMVREGQEQSFSTGDWRGVTDGNTVVRFLEPALALPPGIYNFGSPNCLSLYETVRCVLKPFGKEKLACPTEGNRPRNLCMDPKKAIAHGICFPDTVQGLSDFLRSGL